MTPRVPAQQTPLALKYGRGKSARVLGVSLVNPMANHEVGFLNIFAYFEENLVSSVDWLSTAEAANRLNDRRSAGRHAPPCIYFSSEPRKRRGLKGQRRKFRQRLKQRKQLRVEKKDTEREEETWSTL